MGNSQKAKHQAKKAGKTLSGTYQSHFHTNYLPGNTRATLLTTTRTPQNGHFSSKRPRLPSTKKWLHGI
jgi:hypothetical protein